MKLDEIIAKAEAGKYHDRPDGPPRFTELFDDLVRAKAPHSAAFFAETMHKGAAVLARNLRKLKAKP